MEKMRPGIRIEGNLMTSKIHPEAAPSPVSLRRTPRESRRISRMLFIYLRGNTGKTDIQTRYTKAVVKVISHCKQSQCH
jgi:hypothetical protein